MSDGYKRTHESGSAKRRKKKQAEAEMKQMSGSLLRYVNMVAAVSDAPNVPDIHCNETEYEYEAEIVNAIDGDDLSTQQRHENIEEVFQPNSDAMDRINNNDINSDPALWGEVNTHLIQYYASNTPPQNLDTDLEKSARAFGKVNPVKRHVQRNYFYREMANGEKVNREWLIYSPSTGKVYCYVCKIFQPQVNNITDGEMQFQSGFNDWKNAGSRLSSHERSRFHITAISRMQDVKSSTRIDKEIVKQIETEKQYWINVLKRVIAVIVFLGERGLAFRGDTEVLGSPHNGNYLGCLELLSQFDPFLREHIRQYGNPGKGNVSYLSSSICDEFIELLGTAVTEHIVSEIKKAKYFGISVDSTPDLAHVDQLTVIMRYCLPTGEVTERFLGFVEIAEHTGTYLFAKIQKLLEDHEIDIKNCRSQSYDNASNMSGIYSGVQAQMRQVNELATWVPCAAHSLNLVGASAAECCLQAVNFFGILQSLYSFFSASTQRWQLMLEHMPNKVYVVKSLSDTRWSARADASKALMLNYNNYRLSLQDFAKQGKQPPAAVHEANSLVKKLDKLETAIMCVVWNNILQNTDRVNKALQEPGIEICTVVVLYEGLIAHLKQMRDRYDEFESEAKRYFTTDSDCTYSVDTSRKRTRKVMPNDGHAAEVSQTGKESFVANTFYVIIDKLIVEMDRRREAYAVLNDNFSFLTDEKLSTAEVRDRATNLVKLYPSDLEADFVDEFLMFRSICICSKAETVTDMLQMLVVKNLLNSFPNVTIAFRIYLSIIGTSCTGERTFSVLKRVKNYQRSTMGQPKLSALSILSIECEIVRNLDVSTLIESFASLKCRKVFLS